MMRIFCPKAVYHISQEAVKKNALFLEDNDRKYFLSLLDTLAKQYGFTVLSFCLLDESIHLQAVLCTQVPFVPFGLLFRKYSIYFNQTYNRKGNLFQGRYKAYCSVEPLIILQISRYIHLLPVIKERTEDPLQYPWSSAYLLTTDVPLFAKLVNLSRLCAFFQEAGSKAGLHRYADFLQQAVQQKTVFYYPDVFFGFYVGTVQGLIEIQDFLPRELQEKIALMSSLCAEMPDFYRFLSGRRNVLILKRDSAIYHQHKAGAKIKDLAHTFDLSVRTIQRIISHQEKLRGALVTVL